MKNKIFLMVLIFFSCSNVYALPQDWPCTAFELKKCEQTENENLTDSKSYCGQYDKYVLKVNVFWNTNAESDDCGTAGCDGTIKNIETNQEENLRFFCEAEDDYNVAKCYIRTGEEYILSKVSEGQYIVNLCDNTSYKYVSLEECSGCTCVLHDSRKPDGTLDFYMGCSKNKDYLHCMTGNIYSEKYNPMSSADDFKNCIGLEIE